MGPTWIVVVIRSNGETSVEEFTVEADARSRFDKARNEPHRTLYLATVRSQAEG